MPATFPVGRKINWSYRCLPASARCRIDGQKIKLRIIFSAVLDAVPDVLQIEEAVRELTADRTTVEELACKLFDRFQVPLTVKGRTRTHGVITATI